MHSNTTYVNVKQIPVSGRIYSVPDSNTTYVNVKHGYDKDEYKKD